MKKSKLPPAKPILTLEDLIREHGLLRLHVNKLLNTDQGLVVEVSALKKRLHVLETKGEI